MGVSTRTPKAWSSEGARSEDLNRGPGGWQAICIADAQSTGITTTPITIFSASITVNTSRRLKVDICCGILSANAAGSFNDLVAFNVLLNGGLQGDRIRGHIRETGGPGKITVTGSVPLPALSGTQTVTLQAFLESGTGPLTVDVGSSMVITDVGSAA